MMSNDRRSAFLEAANMCESEILTDDPGTMEEAKALRLGATTALQTMARAFRKRAEMETPS